MSNPKCPICKDTLIKVVYPNCSYLNEDQFEATKYGDWFCRSCPKDEGRPFKYFWDRDLKCSERLPTNDVSEQQNPAQWVCQAEELPPKDAFSKQGYIWLYVKGKLAPSLVDLNQYLQFVSTQPDQWIYWMIVETPCFPSVDEQE